MPESNQDPTILNKIGKNLSEKVAIAKQDTGKTYLSSLLLSQQAEKLVKGKFTSDLKVIASDIPIETEEYRLEVRQADASKAVMVALAKKPGFASYTGAVYAVEGSIPISGMCKTNVPSQTPPQAPKFTYSTILCADGSSAVR
jgi:Type IV pilin-like G and H, putative